MPAIVQFNWAEISYRTCNYDLLGLMIQYNIFLPSHSMRKHERVVCNNGYVLSKFRKRGTAINRLYIEFYSKLEGVAKPINRNGQIQSNSYC